ncbi:ABC transporter permease subunit [Cellulomonas fengjieae]|uniref:ABC transporter permease n=1 Tax=Cellulomonas fengjieae TaxID=2819978 RepID=A0ABS3SKI5_9CELL|nr:ABC transporter permease subunit [Cellulomonas fengjieae]MBO3086177.1 ABC transporter permease [Cellulomonas fengjieae]MBO3102419.1 ABC transporter permease [Cellulomonas fengjieae]QVI65764.1 ABC transporter permease [Cellulomonas fengjieae]
MSTTSTNPVPTAVGDDLSFAGAVLSEWVKLRTIRSTWWLYAILLVLTVALGAQMSSSLSFQGVDGVPTQDAIQDLAVYAVMVSTDFSALVVSVLGVLVIAGEYGTGMIRSTLTAVPRRLTALFAKALVFVIATTVVSAVALALTVPISVGLLSGNGMDVRLDDPQYWLSLLGGVGYLVLVGLIAFSIGALLRTTAGGVATALGLVLAAPLALSLVLGSAEPAWADTIATLLPSTAGSVLVSYPTEQSWVDLAAPAASGWITEPWQGGLVLAAWVVVLLTGAAVLLRRRDA